MAECRVLAKRLVPPLKMTWLEWLSFRYLLRNNRFAEANDILRTLIPRSLGIPDRIFHGETQYSSFRGEYQIAIEWRRKAP